jgi:hypothetical protein
MLTAKQKQDWVNALRSGKYRQSQSGEVGFGNLEGPNGFCCLGVLAKINEWPIENRKVLEINSSNVLIKDPTSLTCLSTAEMGNFRVLGLPTDGYVRSSGLFDHTRYGALAVMNDNGVSFNEIADFLEQHLPTEN